MGGAVLMMILMGFFFRVNNGRPLLCLPRNRARRISH